MLRARWLGRVPYGETYDLQHRIFDARVADQCDDYLLLVEHPHVYTLGRRTDRANLLRTTAEYDDLGVEIVEVDRGGDVTYHGPGQLVAYPILRLDGPGRIPDVVAHVRNLEEIVLRTLLDFGISGHREQGRSGVWTERGKIAAIGCRITRGVSMHGVALNIDPDMQYWSQIVPCGIVGRRVATMQEFVDETPTIKSVSERFIAHAADVFGRDTELAAEAWPRASQSVPVKIRSLRAVAVEAGPDVRAQARERPAWLKRRTDFSAPGYKELKHLMRDLDLNTVCESAGCPNIYECWSERTATMMLLGTRCTRSCGFCDVDTSKPFDIDESEPERVAEAVDKMGLVHAVLTSVARDDIDDGGAEIFARSIRAIRDRRPECDVEVLVPDFKGSKSSFQTVADARPDVFNHNLETIARLQRLCRPQAGYARSLTLLGRASSAGLTTKSGIIVGMGETNDEIVEAMSDLSAVGVEILTLGQYLRPTGRHLPVDRWVTPTEFDELRIAGRELGFLHVEADPLTRSSYHAREAVESAGGAPQ